MKRRITIDIRDARVSAEAGMVIVEGDFNFNVTSLQRFVDVQLLDAKGVSLNQQGMTWTYEDPLDDPLTVGEYVLVPFGWANGEFLAKVVSVGDEPTYKGLAPIKQVTGRMGLVD